MTSSRASSVRSWRATGTNRAVDAALIARPRVDAECLFGHVRKARILEFISNTRVAAVALHPPATASRHLLEFAVRTSNDPVHSTCKMAGAPWDAHSSA
jgi:hypothetical protein